MNWLAWRCWFRPHLWRKAHKKEDQAKSYCRRCSETRAVTKRKPKEKA